MSRVFQFSSSASLEKLTGKRAHTLEELLGLIRDCPGSSIFYHTFSAFLKMLEAKAPLNNDFAVWVSESLNEKPLAEKLMAIDLAEFSTVEALRERLIDIIEAFREEKPNAFAKEGDEPFYLHDVTRFVYLTDKFAYDLKSFRELLPNISIYSLYFHFIESRLHTGLRTNDFSVWFEGTLGMPELAEKIKNIDMHVYTLEGLRSRMMEIIDETSEKSGQGKEADR